MYHKYLRGKQFKMLNNALKWEMSALSLLQLCSHLLPFFSTLTPLSETIQNVEQCVEMENVCFKSTAIMCTLVQTPLSETIQNVKQCVEMEHVCFKYTAIMFTLANVFFNTNSIVRSTTADLCTWIYVHT